MRASEFWSKMDDHFGAGYSSSVASDQVIAGLGHRTVSEAMAAGEDIVVIWRAVCDAYHIPQRQR